MDLNSNIENNIDNIVEDDIASTLEEELDKITSDKNNNLEDTLNFNENRIPDSFMEDDITLDDPFISERNKLKVGISPEDIRSLYDYISGNADKPLFIDKFTSDTEGRLKDMIYIMNLMQLSTLPSLTALQSQIRERLYNAETLRLMNIKELTTASNNITKEIHSIIHNATNSINTFNQTGSLNNEYRKILDRILLLPDNKFNEMREFLNKSDI